MRIPNLFAVIAFAVVQPLVSQEVYKVDAIHSQVGFKVRYLVGKTAGSFGSFQGTIQTFDRSPGKPSVEFTVDAASINTNNADRDKHLRSADFFDVEKYPTLSFKSVSVKEVAKGKLEITGDFTLRGVTKRITVPIASHGITLHPMTKKLTAAYSGSFSINRKDFGMVYGLTDAANIVVGNEVDIELNIFAVKQDPPTGDKP